MEECVVRKCWRLPEIPGNLALDSKNKSSLEYWWGRSSMNIVEERMNDRGGGLNMQMPLCHTWIVWSDAVPGFCLPAPRLAGNFVEIVARNKWIRGGKPKGWWFKWGGIWEAAESSKLLNLKVYAKSFAMESCRVGRKPWDVEVGEVELWRLEKLRYGGWRSSRTQLTVEADPYTHHSPVSHTHPNWEHKYVTSPFSDPRKQSNKRHVCAFAVKSVLYCQEWTRLTWQWVHLLDWLPVDLLLELPPCWIVSLLNWY